MLKWFGSSKNSVKSSQILLCLIGDAADNTDLQHDKIIYQDYQNMTEYHAATGTDLLAFVSGKTYDLVHILASVQADGTVGGVPGIRLLASLSEAGAKLVLFAHANPMDHYIAAFPQKERKGFVEPALVLTFDRKKRQLPQFLRFSVPVDGVRKINADGVGYVSSAA